LKITQVINYDWLKTTTTKGLTTSKEDKINYWKIMGKTDIEWTDRSWNPTVGCSKVSQGCKNCYAMSMSARIANSAFARQKKGKELTDVEKAYMAIVKWESTGPEDSDIKAVPKWNNEIAEIDSRLEEPLNIKKPQRFFVNSMTDLFHPKIENSLIDKIFAVMAAAKEHQFQILTKRPQRMKEYFQRDNLHPRIMTELDHIWERTQDDRCTNAANRIATKGFPLPNVWLGTSVENQETAEERIPELLACPAQVRFLSCEPLLGRLDIGYYFSDEALFRARGYNAWIGKEGPGIHQVIVGGESGHGARPMLYEWVTSIKEQCRFWDVPFFFKQWGKYRPKGQTKPLNTDDDIKEDDVTVLEKFKVDGELRAFHTDGKKENGALLDGEYYREFPKV
jgi:protein gp37